MKMVNKQRKTYKKTSTSARLQFIIVIVASLSIFLLLSLMGLSIRRYTVERELFHMSYEMREFAQAIELNTTVTKNNLVNLAASDTFARANSKECMTQLASNQFRSEIAFSTISRASLDGVFDCSTTASIVGVKALNTGFGVIDEVFQDPDHRARVGRVTYHRQSQESAPFVSIYAPIYINKTFSGVVGSELFIKEFGLGVFERSNAFSNGSFAIVDDNEDVIYESKYTKNLTKLSTSEIIPAEAKSVIKKALSDEAGQRIIRENGSNVLIQPVKISDDRTWIMSTTISDEGVRDSIDSSDFGIHLLMGGVIQWLWAAVFTGLLILFQIVLFMRLLRVRNYE